MKSAISRAFTPCTLALAVSCALLPFVSVTQAQQISSQQNIVQSQRYSFDIAAKPLPQAIADFSAVTGMQVLYTEQAVFSQQAPALNGNFTAAEALQRLTAGTAVTFRFTADGITLEKTPQQQADGPLVLGAVTVTAAAVGTSTLTAPASVSIIEAEELTKRSVTDLTDALRNVPGLAVSGGADSENILIRGLPAEYTMILIDGKRVNTRESRTNGAGGVDQFFLPPVSAIERIEVVRGPMSSLYGTDAMGGVINIITKTASAQWTGSVTAESSLPEHSEDSDQQQLSFFVNGPLLADALGIQIRGRKLDRAAANRIEGNRQVGPEQRDLTDLYLRLNSQLLPAHEFELEIGETETEVGIRDDSRKSFALEHATLAGDWDLTSNWHLERAKRQTEGSARSPETENSIVDVKGSSEQQWLGSHAFTLGAQWAEAALSDFNPGLADNIQYRFSSRQQAVFAEDIWQLSPALAVTLGGRYTDDDRSKAKFTPRLYSVLEINPSLFFSAGFSTGFRTPELRESVEGYYLTSGQGRTVLVGTADLKPEESVNSEVGLRFENDHINANATIFLTDFENKISSLDTGTTMQLGRITYNVFKYYNIEKGRSRGLELSSVYQWGDLVKLTGSYTFTETEHRSGSLSGRPLSRTPKHLADLQFDWQSPLEQLALWSAVRYQGDSVQVQSSSRGNTVVEYSDHTTLDLGLTYSFSARLRLKTALHNLADVTISHTEHGAAENGRTLWLALTAEF